MVSTPGWTLRHDWRTRAILGAWVGLSLFAGMYWALAHAALALSLQPSWPWPLLVAAVAGISGSLYGASLPPADPWRVHWRSDRWFMAAVLDPAPETAGRLHPMIDLGSWMLVRYQSDQGDRVRWFVARAGSIGGQWHAFRAALFWPRPAAPGPARIDGR